MLIRPMEPSDVEVCVEFGRLLHDESPNYGHLEYDEYKVRSLAEACLVKPELSCFVAEHEGNVVGMMMGVICEHFFSNSSFATDLSIFVRPENRGSSAALRLITAFCIWAETMKCEQIRCGVSTGINEETVDRMYKKFGFVQQGRLYVKTVDQSKLVH